MVDHAPKDRLKDFLEGLRSLSQFYGCDRIDVHTRGSTGDTPLKVAVVRQDVDAIRDLLAVGADPNVPGEDDYTPLHHAAGGESQEIVRLLLEHGASTSRVDIYGHTPLHYADDKSIYALLTGKNA